MQICPPLACKIACFCWQKCMQLAVRNTRNLSQKSSQFQAIPLPHCRKIHLQNADKLACILQVKLPATYVLFACGGVCSAWGACHINAGNFTFSYRLAARNAGILYVELLYMHDSACKVSRFCKYCNRVRRPPLAARKLQWEKKFLQKKGVFHCIAKTDQSILGDRISEKNRCFWKQTSLTPN